MGWGLSDIDIEESSYALKRDILAMQFEDYRSKQDTAQRIIRTLLAGGLILVTFARSELGSLANGIWPPPYPRALPIEESITVSLRSAVAMTHWSGLLFIGISASLLFGSGIICLYVLRTDNLRPIGPVKTVHLDESTHKGVPPDRLTKWLRTNDDRLYQLSRNMEWCFSGIYHCIVLLIFAVLLLGAASLEYLPFIAAANLLVLCTFAGTCIVYLKGIPLQVFKNSQEGLKTAIQSGFSEFDRIMYEVGPSPPIKIAYILVFYQPARYSFEIVEYWMLM